MDIGYNTHQSNEWYHQKTGEWLLRYEQTQLANFLLEMPADYLLQFGGSINMMHVGSSLAKKKYFVAAEFHQDKNSRVLTTDIRELPFLRDSVDIVVLVHVIEFLEHPAVFLKDIYDILTGGGKLVLLVFNPWSFWGMTKLFKRCQAFPWQGTFWMRSQVERWLRVLGYKIILNKTICFYPPSPKEPNIRLAWFSEVLGQLCVPAWGGVSLLIAEKEVYDPCLIQERAWQKRSLLNSSVIGPTARCGH